jgi:hypothetical protein
VTSPTSPLSTTRRRIAAGAIAGLTAAAGLFVAAGPASSQSASCTGTATVAFGTASMTSTSSLLTSNTVPEWGWVTSRTYAASIPAGTYQLSAVSYDGYETRAATTGQTQEIWKVEFLGAGGTVLATSGATSDLADGVQEATWSGSLGTVTLAEPATQVRTVHAFPTDDRVAHSVKPICLGATLQTPPTTTAPPTTTTPPTSTIPTEVLPEILVPTTPPARPQTTQPSYTG